jgi:hypothetical protein
VTYSRTTWFNGSGAALNATNLNNIEDGIVALQTTSIGATQTGNFTLAPTNPIQTIQINSASSVAVTVPTLAAGTTVELVRMGAGAVTLTASGTTLRYPSGATPSPRLQYSSISLLWLSTTEVLVTGDMA